MSTLYRLRDIPGWAAHLEEYRGQINPVFSDYEWHMAGEVCTPIHAVEGSTSLVAPAVLLVQHLLYRQTRTPRRLRLIGGGP